MMRQNKARSLAFRLLPLLLLASCGGGGGSAPVAPGAPAIGQATPGDRALTVSFTPPASDGGAAVSGYTATCKSGLLDSSSVSGGASPLTVTGLVNGREYSCSVTARNAAGEGPASSSVAATPYTTPGAPTLGAVTAGDGVIDAAFSAPAENGGSAITEYRLGCAAGGSTRSVSGAASPLRLAGLSNGTAYSCTVTARNAAGEGAASAAQSATPRTLPGAPTVSSVAADIGALVITAAAPASDGGTPITAYTAQCSAGGQTQTGTSSSTRIGVPGLTNGVAYSCTVRATNAAGSGPASAAASGTPRDISREARLTSTMDQSAGRATVTWKDVFAAGTTYRVETGTPTGLLTSRGTVATGTGTGGTLSWSVDVADTMVIRVIAVRPGLGEVALMSDIMESFVFVAYVSPTAPPTILVDMAEPISGIVRLAISGGVVYSWVDWFVDTTKLGTVMHTEGPGNPITWNSNAVATGDHVLIARIQTASNSVVELRRIVRVAHLNLYPDYRLFDGVYHATVNANSAAGIVSVDMRVDGVALGTLTTPNCAQCDPAATSYRWRLDPARFPSGSYPATVSAVDRSGLRKSLDFTVVIRYPPVLTIDQPTDFQIFNGKLELRGRVTSDRAGPVRTEVKLEQLTLLDTTAQTLDFSLDLTGIAPRVYLLNITSRDSANVPVTIERRVIVTASPQRVYTPAMTIDPAATPVHSDGVRVLWQGSDGAYRIQPFGGTAITLLSSDTASLRYTNDWQISNGRVYAMGKGADCSVNLCVYEWDPAGFRRNLSTASPYQTSGGVACDSNGLVVRGDQVLWAITGCTPVRLTLYNAVTGVYRRIDPPADAPNIGNINFDVTSDGAAVYYFAVTANTADGVIAHVYRQGASGSAQRLTSTPDRNLYPRTNGTRIAWQRMPASGIGALEVISADANGANARSLTTLTEYWRFSDQTVSWSDALESNRWGQVTKRALRADYNGTTYTLSTNVWGALLAGTQAQVFFKDNESFSRWDGTTVQTTLMLEAVPSYIWAANGAVVFTFGGGKIYRLAAP